MAQRGAFHNLKRPDVTLNSPRLGENSTRKIFVVDNQTQF